jgi:molybdopterin synthase sulfur carrier subunit
MNVFIPSPLRSYTNERPEVSANGATIAGLLDDLNRQYPGIRFRMIDEQEQIRTHIKIFLNREQIRELATPLKQNDEILIVCALSGG